MKIKLLILVLLVCLVGCGQEPEFKMINKGEVSKVEYQKGDFSNSPKTIIYFVDGRIAYLTGGYPIPGKKIEIYEKRAGRYKIEEVR